MATTTDAFDIEHLYLLVSQRTGLEPGAAMENTRVVCQVLGEILDFDTVSLLRRTVPEPLAELFEPAPQSPEHHAPHQATQARILATGKPGSHRPLSESTSDRAQRDSIARTANPHGDSKLSSTPGTGED